MIRRIRENIATHNWFAVSVDLAILVAGVFLGIQASNWNQARVDRAEARALRAQIVENLKANESDVAARTAYYRQVRAHALSALAAIKQPGDRLGEPFLIDAYQASQMWRRPFERTAYDELQQSGVTRLIGDREIRGDLSSYYVSARGFELTAADQTGYRDKLRSAMDLDVQLAIRDRCDDRVRRLPSGVEVPELPRDCRLGLDPVKARGAAAQVAAIDRVGQELTRLIIDIDQKLGLFARTSGNAAHLRTELEAL